MSEKMPSVRWKLVCNTALISRLGNPESETCLKFRTSLEIGLPMGGWGLCKCLSNTFKKQAGTCLWCLCQGIGFFFFPPPLRWVGRVLYWMRFFRLIHTNTDLCIDVPFLCVSMFLKKETRKEQKRLSPFLSVTLVEPDSVMLPLYTVFHSLCIFIPQIVTFNHVITASCTQLHTFCPSPDTEK